jgi:isopenicillin N synthase-like dioxygenase
MQEDVRVEAELLTSGLGRKRSVRQGDGKDVVVVPVIDFEASSSSSSSSSSSLDEQLYSAATEVGFFTIVNAPFVGKEDIERQFALSKKFFARPRDVKERESPYAAQLNSGYEYKQQVRPSTRLKDEKESFQITAKESSMEKRWPKDMGDEFEKQTREFMAKSLELAKMLIACLQRERTKRRRCERGGREEEEEEEDIASKHSLWRENESQCTLRMIHYPPFGSIEEAEEQAKLGYMRAGAHTDWCNVTLLYQQTEFGNGGLECAANPRRDGFVDTEWAQIDHTRPGAITVNIGDMLSRWTNGDLLSNLHRVRMPEGEEALKSRHSMAFFAQADESAVIRVPGQKSLTAKEYILGRIRSNYGGTADDAAVKEAKS